MRYESIKKRGEQWVKIRPALQVYDDSAVLKETVEDTWWLTEISEDSVRLESRDTGHSRYIGLDHIHNYMQDPEGERRPGGTTGTLILNVQLLLFESKLLAEPVAPPGAPLKHFVPARSRETLYSTAARAAAAATLAKRRKEYAWSHEGVQAARRAFDELETAFRTLSEDLQRQGHDVPISIKRHGLCFVLGACGWWLIFTWAQQASNVIEDARLNVEKYDSHPPFPGVLTIEPAHRLGVEQFGFGLVAHDEARWIEWGNWERSFTSMDLATTILTDLLRRPNITLR